MRMSRTDSTLPRLTPYRSGETTVSSSARVRPVFSELTRTITRLPSSRRAGTHSRAISRAAAFSPGGTESSRSTMMMSESKERARSSILARLPGTKMTLRISCIRYAHFLQVWRTGVFHYLAPFGFRAYNFIYSAWVSCHFFLLNSIRPCLLRYT